MDVTMPDLNGIDATRQIRGDNPTSKVIGLSMHRERQFVMQMLAASASGYLLKDSPLEELIAAIEAVARGEVFLSSKITDVLVEQCSAGAVQTESFCGSLTQCEREVLQLVAEGKNAKEIGQDPAHQQQDGRRASAAADGQAQAVQHRGTDALRDSRRDERIGLDR